MATFDFAPFASLKKLLDLEKSAISDYPQLEEISERVLRAFEAYVGYAMELGDYSKTWYIQTPTKNIYFDALPLSTIYTFMKDGIDITDYKLTNYGILLPSAIKDCEITLTYEAGYDNETYPNIIKEAALIQVCYEYGTVDNIGATITTTDGGSIQRPELGLLKETMRMLDDFQSPSKVMLL